MNRNALITCATGETGRAAVEESITPALTVRAMVHGKDDRSAVLEEAGCRSRAGRSPQIDTIREAMEGIDAAYLVYPVQAGLSDATVSFTHAGEAGVSAIVRHEASLDA